MTDDHLHTNHEDSRSWYSIPECPWIPQCDLLLLPGGCDACDFMNPDLPRDEDGELLDIPDDPECPTT